MELLKRLPVPALHRYDRKDLPWDVVAAGAVAFLAVPQGLAYATIAGLPPAMGLYAAAVPTIIGSLFRSSSHVVAGPTSYLVDRDQVIRYKGLRGTALLRRIEELLKKPGRDRRQ